MHCCVADADGKLHCPSCKKTFSRQRHYNTHLCRANSDYVDLSLKDVQVDLDLLSDEEEDDLDHSTDYKYVLCFSYK